MNKDKSTKHTIKVSEKNRKALIKLAGLKQIITLNVETFDSVITDLLKLEYILTDSKETKEKS